MEQGQELFEHHLKATQRFIESIPRLAANHARNYFDKSFTDKGFTDQVFSPWAPVREKNGKTKERPLVKSGRLRRSLRTIPGEVYTDVEYAAVHNDGGTITRGARSELFVRSRLSSGKRKGKFKKGTTAGRGFTFKEHSYKMPQRQFMGPSATLEKEIEDLIVEGINSALQPK